METEEVHTELVHNVKLIQQGDMVLHHIARTKQEFESESIAVWKELTNQPGLMIDVGSYTGLYAILGAKLGASMVALEPNPPSFWRMGQNMRLNGVYFASLPWAASSNWGHAKLSRRFPLSSGACISSSGIDVQTVPLDWFNWSKIRAVKIDVEGHELAVLEGAYQIIKRDRPVMIIEALTENLEEEIKSFLDGYTVDRTDERNLICRP